MADLLTLAFQYWVGTCLGSLDPLDEAVWDTHLIICFLFKLQNEIHGKPIETLHLPTTIENLHVYLSDCVGI